MMNKKGGVNLRDVMFIMVIFSVIMALSSIFVIGMATEYVNDDMLFEYSNENMSTLGNNSFTSVDSSVTKMKSNVDGEGGLLKSFGLVGEVITGAATILGEVLKAPIHVKEASIVMLNALGVPNEVRGFIGNAVMYLIYLVVIFGIASALLRGGKL